MQQLKNLPWRWLMQSAIAANLVAMVMELVLVFAVAYSSAMRQSLGFLLSSPLLGTLLPIAALVGVGALSVYLLELWNQQYLLNRNSLWALVGCLLLVLLLKTILPLPSFLTSLSRGGLVSVLIGVFWKGRPYWRYR